MFSLFWAFVGSEETNFRFIVLVYMSKCAHILRTPAEPWNSSIDLSANLEVICMVVCWDFFEFHEI